MVHYLRITRTSPGIGMGGGPDNHMNVIKLEGLLGTQSRAYFCATNSKICRCWQRYYAANGFVSDIFLYNGLNTWFRLNDGVAPLHGYLKEAVAFVPEGTMAHTTNTPNAYMELDFGPAGRRMNKVRVMHRFAEIRRSNGMTLEAKDPSGKVIFRHTFSGITTLSRGTDIINMKGEVVTA
jgi:hypothetical protein